MISSTPISLAAPFSVPKHHGSSSLHHRRPDRLRRYALPTQHQPDPPHPILHGVELRHPVSMTKSIVFESTYLGSKETKLPLSILMNVVNPQPTRLARVLPTSPIVLTPIFLFSPVTTSEETRSYLHPGMHLFEVHRGQQRLQLLRNPCRIPTICGPIADYQTSTCVIASSSVP